MPYTQSSDKTEIELIFNYLLEDEPSKKPLVIGVIGIDDEKLLAVVLTKLSTLSHRRSINLHYFVENEHSLKGLATILTPLTELGKQLDNISHCAITGCHRLIAADGNLVFDVHLGDWVTQLAAFDNNARYQMSHWLLLNSLATAKIINHRLISPMVQITDSDGQLLLGLTVTDLQKQQLQQQISASTITLTPLERSKNPHKSRSTVTPDHFTLMDTIDESPINAIKKGKIAIVGGGIASAFLTLSLAERGQASHLFCMDDAPAQQASGNRQGALYPLLNPENDSLSQFFLQGYLFSRHRIRSLVEQGFTIEHDFCGVVQTGYNRRSRLRLNKIITSRTWPSSIIRTIDADEASVIAGIPIERDGVYYPLGGWVNPHQLSVAAIKKATALVPLEKHFNTVITHIEQINGQWFLDAYHDQRSLRFGPFEKVVLATGQQLTEFNQTSQLPLSAFRGQVSHIPSRGQLKQLKTVLCAQGYLTPSEGFLHCTGASYVKAATNNDYSAVEQLENLTKLRGSYSAPWIEDVDITGHCARVGVRMVSRDHVPMVGSAPDFDAIMQRYQPRQQAKERSQYWRSVTAPIHAGLFILGAFGSRGLTSSPLAAEILAAQLCEQLPPTTSDIMTLLNPNRIWLRRLQKGKALIK